MFSNKADFKTLWKLFISNLYISAFTFGGGFVIVTFMKAKYVDELHWIDENEMLDLIALAQSSPGAIAVNGAILVGWKIGGLIGMIVSVIACIIPPMVILTLVSIFYNAFITNPYIALTLKGMQAGVGAVLANVVYGLASNVIKQKVWIQYIIMVAAFIATYFLGINVIYIILVSALVGVIYTFATKKKEVCE